MEIRNIKGFSLIEMVVMIAILGILIAIAIPGYMNMAPRMRLKSAARDIVSDIQLAKMEALRDRKSYIMQFDEAGNKYTVSTGGIVKKTVNLDEYAGISFGSGYGKAGADPGADDTSDGITFKDNKIIFGTDSTVNAGGVYLKDADNTTYSVICLSAAGGIETLKNSDGSSWE